MCAAEASMTLCHNIMRSDAWEAPEVGTEREVAQRPSSLLHPCLPDCDVGGSVPRDQLCAHCQCRDVHQLPGGGVLHDLKVCGEVHRSARGWRACAAQGRTGACAVDQLPGGVVLYHLSSIEVVCMSGDLQREEER